MPILTRHTIKEAIGNERVEKAVVVRLDENWRQMEGTEREFDVEMICLSVGMSPLIDLLRTAGCEMAFIPELGGYTPIHNEDLETTVKGIYVAGDSSGVEEASTAIVEGKLAGLNAAVSLGYWNENVDAIRLDLRRQLEVLRAGPFGELRRRGKEKMWRLK